MNKFLRATFIGQIGFFVIWAVYLMTAYKGAPTIWLETSPVDPRDLLSGQYVALGYPINSPTVGECAAMLSGNRASMYSQFFVKLAPSGVTKETVAGPVQIWTAFDCQSTPPPNDSKDIWVQGYAQSSWNRSTLRFGIERYFLSETNLLKDARSGQVVAQIAVNSKHQARILSLVKLK